MNKQIYIIPEIEICIVRLNGQVLEGYTVIDLSNPKPQEVTGGEINSNGGGIWDEVDSGSHGESELWDKL